MGITRFLFTGLSLLAAISSADNSTVTYDWRVTLAIIDVELGQTVQVTVTNELGEPTCLHWHGLQQLGTQEMDGTSDITQCGIPAGGSAIYTFTPERAGTFWWRSHDSTQYAFGLRGPLIVHAPADQQQS
ncbi:unnamed protein product [Phytophthora lilii]|uniref:Unnamed protein product n=1 Tax=Phytophthora lilii TaxID=2077276 RepID=A0A9W6U1L7_9STRA|nr:unnamed protein product [Phytophthora lilii]